MVALIAAAEGKIRRRFVELVEWIRAQHSLPEVLAAIEAGTEPTLVVAHLERAARAIAKETIDAYIAAGEEAAGYLSVKLGQPVDFDTTNWRAVERMQSQSLGMIREFVDEQIQTTRAALTEGVRLGLNPRDQARTFRDVVGLTEYQSQIVANYRAELNALDGNALSRELRDRRFDRTVDRAVRTRTPLSQDQIDRMVERYRQGWIRYRSEVIARTEALRSVHEGTEDMFSQAIAEGELEPEQLVSRWKCRIRGSRDWHIAMNGQIRPFGVPFTSGKGRSLRYPGDPHAPADEVCQCACVKITKVTKLSLYKRLARNESCRVTA